MQYATTAAMRQADEQSRPGGLGGGTDGREHAGADHRTEPDDDGVAEAEATGEPGRRVVA